MMKNDILNKEFAMWLLSRLLSYTMTHYFMSSNVEIGRLLLMRLARCIVVVVWGKLRHRAPHNHKKKLCTGLLGVGYVD